MKWWDESWNPVTGCSPVSEGCTYCYAERMTNRNLWGYDFTPRFHPSRLAIPDKWSKPRRIFVCSMGDLFHKDVANDWVCAVMLRIINNPRHTFMLLTKRPDRMKEYFEHRGQPIANLWLGVTAENQARADERIPILLDTPAAHRFVSIEPMLGPLDINEYLHDSHCDYAMRPISINPFCICSDPREVHINHVILGGEIGLRAREMEAEWARAIRDQCAEAGTPYFMKQMTNKAPIPDDLLIRELP